MSYLTKANNACSTAMGQITKALGSSSTAMGYNTVASGVRSTAVGFFTEAGGDSSFVGGQNMQQTDTADHSFIWGHSGTTKVLQEPNVFLIFPVGTPGKVGIGTPEPKTKLDIQGETNASVLSRINQIGSKNWCGLRLDRNISEKWFIGMPNNNDYLSQCGLRPQPKVGKLAINKNVQEPHQIRISRAV